MTFSLSSGLDDAVNFGEEGTGSGLIVCFDTYDNGGGEAPAIYLKYGGTSEEPIDTDGNQVVKTNVPKATLVNNRWSDVVVQVTADGKITVIHNNVKYFDQVQIPGWFPIPGARAAWGGRTGDEWEAAWLDDVALTFNADVLLTQPPVRSPLPPRRIAGSTESNANSVLIPSARGRPSAPFCSA